MLIINGSKLTFNSTVTASGQNGAVVIFRDELTPGLEYIDGSAVVIVNGTPFNLTTTTPPTGTNFFLTETAATPPNGEIIEIRLPALASADPTLIDITFEASVTDTFDFTANQLDNTGQFFMYEDDTAANNDPTHTNPETSGEKNMDPIAIGPYVINAAAISVDVPAVPTTQYNTVLRFRAPKGDFTYGHYTFTETIPDEYVGDISFQPAASVSAYIEGGNADGSNLDITTVASALSVNGKTMTVEFDDAPEMNDKYVYITIPMVDDTITTNQTVLLPCTAKLEAGPGPAGSADNTTINDPEFNEQVNFIAQPSLSTVTKNLVI